MPIRIPRINKVTQAQPVTQIPNGVAEAQQRLAASQDAIGRRTGANIARLVRGTVRNNERAAVRAEREEALEQREQQRVALDDAYEQATSFYNAEEAADSVSGLFEDESQRDAVRRGLLSSGVATQLAADPSSATELSEDQINQLTPEMRNAVLKARRTEVKSRFNDRGPGAVQQEFQLISNLPPSEQTEATRDLMTRVVANQTYWETNKERAIELFGQAGYDRNVLMLKQAYVASEQILAQSSIAENLLDSEAVIFDERNRKIFLEGTDRQIQESMFEGEFEEAIGLASRQIVQAGRTGNAVKSILSTGAHSADPMRAMAAARFYGAINERHSGMDWGKVVDRDTEEKLSAIWLHMQAFPESTNDPEHAAHILTGVKETLDRRRDERDGSNLDKDGNRIAALQDQLSIAVEKELEGAPSAVRRKAKILAEAFADRNGLGADKASEQAIARVKRDYGPTRVGSDRDWQYKPIRPGSWQEKQLQAEVPVLQGREFTYRASVDENGETVYTFWQRGLDNVERLIELDGNGAIAWKPEYEKTDEYIRGRALEYQERLKAQDDLIRDARLIRDGSDDPEDQDRLRGLRQHFDQLNEEYRAAMELVSDLQPKFYRDTGKYVDEYLEAKSRLSEAEDRMRQFHPDTMSTLAREAKVKLESEGRGFIKEHEKRHKKSMESVSGDPADFYFWGTGEAAGAGKPPIFGAGFTGN